MLNLTYLRNAVTAAGGTPTQVSEIGLLRQLVEAYGGTPTKWEPLALLRQAISASGGSPTQTSDIGLMRELIAARGLSSQQASANGLLQFLGGGGGTPTPTPSDITFDPLYTTSGANWVFTARRSTNIANAENRTITVAGSTTYPPAAIAADFGGAFPSVSASFLAGAATATFTIPTNSLVQPE